jgi:N-acetylneuraminic acid mutarotase
MWVEPAPPNDGVSATLKVVRPDGIVDVFSLFLDKGGKGTWLYAPNQVGTFTFQFIFSEQTFTNGTEYKPSSSSTVLLVPGTPRPSMESDGGSWQPKASMSEARGILGVVALDGKIYAIGGTAEGNFLATNEEYNPVTDTWTLKKSMPTPRAKFAIAAVQGKIYCIGGIIGVEAYSTFPSPSSQQTDTELSYTLVNFVHYRNILTNVNEVYDPTSDTWETKASLPRNMTGDTANVVNGEIYLVSGTETFVYDPIHDSWTTAASKPTAEGSYVSCVIGDKIYFFIAQRPVYIYEPETDSWHEGAYAPVMEISGPAGATTGVFAKGLAYLFGIEPFVANHQENDSAAERRVNFVYDPATDTWSAGDRILTYRRDFGIANIEDRLYLVGGYDSAVNEQYTPLGYGSIPSGSAPAFVIVVATVVAVAALLYVKKRKP